MDALINFCLDVVDADAGVVDFFTADADVDAEGVADCFSLCIVELRGSTNLSFSITRIDEFSDLSSDPTDLDAVDDDDLFDFR